MLFTRVIVVLCLIVAGFAQAETFRVNSGRDSHDANPGDGVAADEFGQDTSSCSLRASVEEANALPGPDTVLVPDSLGPINLKLGSIILDDNGTVVVGHNGRPVLDGVNNPIGHATFVVTSDSCKISRFVIQRSRGSAIVILGSTNEVGGSAPGEGLLLVGNNLDDSSGSAVKISGSGATHNTLKGNYIGLVADGVTPWGNSHGVLLDHGAASNLIGGVMPSSRNIISGNTGWGVIITGGAKDNEVAGNLIGVDSTGDFGPGNGSGGVLLRTNTTGNLIGSHNITTGNVISANRGPGIELSGHEVYSNCIDGNLIGTVASGEMPLANVGDGILLTDGAHNNTLGTPTPNSGNLISGNINSGIHLSGEGVSRNVITANWIGIGLDGFSGIGNCMFGGSGILIDSGASINTVGGSVSAARNVISANYGFGVLIDGAGTANNIVQGNYIGLNSTGTSSLGNSVGLGISGSAQANLIGGTGPTFRNVISGNRSDDFPYGAGVLIYGSGTSYNRVTANIIGLDKDGLRSRRNGSCGVIIGGGAQYNFIGGTWPDNSNIISGNGVDEPVEGRAGGIHIYGASTAWNCIEGNVIGQDLTLDGVIGNRGHGIGIYSGAHHNNIGGDSRALGNFVVGNEGAGIFVAGSDTQNNLIRYNLTRDNAGLGIALRDSAQQGMFPPVITRVGRLSVDGPRLVSGRDALPSARIDVYRVVSPDPSGAGEGDWLLGYTFAGSNGRFEFYLPSGPAMPIILTAVASDAEGNSSEFSVNGYSPDATLVEDSEELLPLDFSLSQNYPNPFNATTRIVFSLPRKAEATLAVYNVLGQQVRTLTEGVFSAGEHEAVWDGTDESGAEVASGVYFYRLVSETQRIARKMVLLK
jgi:hypothetical protein